MADKDEYVRVQATLKEDAHATLETNGGTNGGACCGGYSVHLLLRVPGRVGEQDITVSFKAHGFKPGDIQDLVAGLKKDKIVELVSKLDNGKLIAKYVRIERVDYQMECQLL